VWQPSELLYIWYCYLLLYGRPSALSRIQLDFHVHRHRVEPIHVRRHSHKQRLHRSSLRRCSSLQPISWLRTRPSLCLSQRSTAATSVGGFAAQCPSCVQQILTDTAAGAGGQLHGADSLRTSLNTSGCTTGC